MKFLRRQETSLLIYERCIVVTRDVKTLRSAGKHSITNSCAIGASELLLNLQMKFKSVSMD